MDTNFYLKSLQRVASDQNQSGFTLLELLVVVVIMGVLSAIATPSMLNQMGRAQEATARSYIGAVNRSQQVYRLDNATFADDISVLQVGIPSGSEGYTYAIGNVSSAVAEFQATPEMNNLIALTGCARADNDVDITTTDTSILEAEALGDDPPDCEI